jgi:hypothetical protein
MKSHILSHQLILLFFLTLIAGCLLFAPLVVEHKLYWDHPSWFSFFRDNLHSLNYFGEVQWWNPNAATGFPNYYPSFLANSNAAPLFVALGFFVWILGRCGVYISTYYWWYVAFVGFVIPFCFNLSVLSLARQIFKDSRVIYYSLIVSSFSPGIVFNASDVSFEPTIYAVFAAAAFLKFQTHPKKVTFLGLAVSLIAFALALSVSALTWMAVFVPLFIVTCLFINPKRFLPTAKTLMNSVSYWHWLALAVCLIMCILPKLLVNQDGADIMRSSTGTRSYSYWDISSGNPLEFLSTNIPGTSLTVHEEHEYSWLKEQSTLSAKVLNASLQGSLSLPHAAYTYLGVLCFPLVIVGLLCGRSLWRKRLFVMLVFCMTILILSAYSPLMSAILAWPTPLRTVNHFSDISFRAGAFLLLILTAGLGLEIFLRIPQKIGRIVWRCFLWTSLFAVMTFWVVLGVRVAFMGLWLYPYFQAKQLIMETILPAISASRFVFYMTFNVCFLILMIVLFMLTILWMRRLQTVKRRRVAVIVLLVLTLIDVSTVTFSYIRFIMQPNAVKIEEPIITTIGTPGKMGEYANTLLYLQSVKNAEVDVTTLPILALSKHLSEWGFLRSTPLDVLHDMQNGQIKILKQTYNSLLLKVYAPEKAMLFWRDAYFPHWQAIVNQRKASIVPVFGACKAVVVPQGDSIVEFRFFPGLIAVSFLFAYTIFILTSGFWIFKRHDLN